ncbi:hypothetical protein AB0P17_36385 [Streptomyces sp. NPDC088124]|uniref:hypothetical protein n=1 Tax=Streptomyces sp. NPDC088124 TaxID=3154654 RepID=UPI00342FFF88
MRYAVISPEGTLSIHHDTEPVDVETLVGPEGRARVRLLPSFGTAGWVNDCGLALPERYPRNVVGSCVLYAFGAALQPYAGPVVLTGWSPNGAGSEVCSLDMPDVMLVSIHADVRRALANQRLKDFTPSFGTQIREFAEHVRTAPTLGITITTVSIPRGGAS